MGEHKSAEILRKEIEEGMRQIPIGSRWGHFKHPDNYYVITGFLVIEETDEIGVQYKSTFEPTKDITFLRSVESFLSSKETEEGPVKRFTMVA